MASTPGQHGLEEVRTDFHTTFLSSLLPPASLADPGEAWELWQLEISGAAGNWEKQLVEVAAELEAEVEGAQLGGTFTSVFGPVQVPLQ